MLDRIIDYLVQCILWAGVILMGLLIADGIARSEPSYGLGLSKLDIEYQQFNKDNRDPYAPQYTGEWREGAAILMDISALRWLYWNNRIHMETTDGSGRATGTGWQWEGGIHVSEWIDVFQYHHSRHLLDEPSPVTDPHKFPVENAIGVRVHLLGGK